MKNTYKTTKLLRIPESNLILLVDENNGAYIFDFITYQTLY